jgi:hypothetical protein
MKAGSLCAVSIEGKGQLMYDLANDFGKGLKAIWGL